MLIFVKGGSENKAALKRLSNELYSKAYASCGLANFYYGFTPYTGTHEYDYCQITFEVKGTAAQLAFLNIVDGRFEIIRVEPEDATTEGEAIAQWAKEHEQRPLPKEAGPPKKEAEPPLIQALRDGVGDARWQAAFALGQAQDPGAVMVLISVLDDREEKVRGAAATALGNIGDARAVEPLVGALDDQHWRVREQAAFALGMIAGADVVKPLIRCLKDEQSDVRYAAAESLGNLGDRAAVKPLIKTLKDAESNVRRIAALALGDIGDVDAKEALNEAARDEHVSVREAANKALEMIGVATRGEPTETPESKHEDFVKCWYCQTRPADPEISVHITVKQGDRQMTIKVPRCQHCLSAVQGTGQRIAWGLAVVTAMSTVLCLLSALVLSSWWLGFVVAIVSACIAVYAAFGLEKRRYRTAGTRMIKVYITRFPGTVLRILGDRGWTHYESLATQLAEQSSSRWVQGEAQ